MTDFIKPSDEAYNLMLKLTGSEPLPLVNTAKPDLEEAASTLGREYNVDTNQDVFDYIIEERKAKLANHPLKGKLVDDLCTNLGAYVYFSLADVKVLSYKDVESNTIIVESDEVGTACFIVGLTPNKLYKVQDLSNLRYSGVITNDQGETIPIGLKGKSKHLAGVANFILVSNPTMIKSVIAGTHPNITI